MGGFFFTNTVNHSFLTRKSPMIPINTSMNRTGNDDLCVHGEAPFWEAART